MLSINVICVSSNNHADNWLHDDNDDEQTTEIKEKVCRKQSKLKVTKKPKCLMEFWIDRCAHPKYFNDTHTHRQTIVFWLYNRQISLVFAFDNDDNDDENRILNKTKKNFTFFLSFSIYGIKFRLLIAASIHTQTQYWLVDCCSQFFFIWCQLSYSIVLN